MLTIPITVTSMIYMILLSIAYFSKKRLSNIENKLYALMIKLACFGIVVDSVSCMFVMNNMTQSVYFRMVTLFMFVYYILWSGVFVAYIFTISYKKNNLTDREFEKKYGKVKNGILTFYIICAFLAVIFPLNYVTEGDQIYPDGLAVNFTYFIAAFFSIVVMLLLLFKNRQNIKSKKYIPLYALIILFLGVVVIQKYNPNLILTTAVECFITFLMYFTVENPDVQLIDELYKNKKLIENSNEETSKFLFKLTQEIKNPVRELQNLGNEMKNANKKDEFEVLAECVSNYSNKLDYLVNKALNISNMDTQKIKVFDSKYNVYNLSKEVGHGIDFGEIQFEKNVGSNTPAYLYGDSIKLKQIINSLLSNAVKNTESGFISFDINSIIKYDVCRLFIVIQDSGKGISIEKVNRFLSPTNEEDIDEKISDNDLNYSEIKKMVNVLGGSLLLQSEVNKGTTVTITLDQKVVSSVDSDLSKRLDSYEQTLNSGVKCLVVDDDEDELNGIAKILEDSDIEVEKTIFENDCVNKISRKYKYDFIILDDEMPNRNAINILKDLQEIKGFKIPVIVMINDNKEGIKLQYLKDGFADYVLKSKLNSEIKRIIKRF